MKLRNLLALSTCILFLSNLANAADLKAGFVEQRVTDKVIGPTSMAFPSDGRLFVAVKSGSVWIIEDGELLTTPMLSMEVDEFGERGLGGLVLDPDFDNNGYFYVYYSVKGKEKNRVARWTANGNSVIAGSEVVILEVEGLVSITHNGGAMMFDSEGHLFITVGDNLKSSAPQSLGNLFGKVLRVYPDGSIPVDNPYYNETSGINRSIYAIGFRNPFTAAINPLTDQIFLNDVGNTEWEELDKLIPGGNYGWPIIEGPIQDQEAPDNYVEPLHYYNHSEGCAIVGAAFYTPEKMNFPDEYAGKYFFGEYCEGLLVSIDTNGVVFDTIATGLNSVSSLGVSTDGILYYLSFNRGLFKISYSGSGEPIVSENPSDVVAVESENVEFSVFVIGEEVITYQWYKDESAISGETSSVLELDNVLLADSNSTFYCHIQNDLGEVYSDTVTLIVTKNQRPIPTITNLGTLKYKGGDTLRIFGSAIDTEDGNLNKANFEWVVDFHHNEHSHPGLPLTVGVDSVELIIPVYGETATNVWYRVQLWAQDQMGLYGKTTLDIFPEISEITLTTNFDGATINIDGQLSSDSTLSAVAGLVRVFEADAQVIRNDSLFVFDSWSNGDTNHTLEIIVDEDDVTFEASYVYSERYFIGDGDGLRGDYYGEELLQGPIMATRVDPTIDFKFEWSSPIDEITNIEFFSISWTGRILAPVSGEYTFYFKYNDAVQFFVNDIVYLDKFCCQGDNEDSVNITLEAGVYYDLKLNYSEHQWLAFIDWQWKHKYTEKEIVPTTQLYSSDVTNLFEHSNDIAEVFPTISDGNVNVTMRDYGAGRVNYLIQDVHGNIVLSGDGIVTGNTFNINYSKLSDGVYIINLLLTDEKISKRVMKITP